VARAVPRLRSLQGKGEMTAPLRVTCFVPTFNAGDTTRGIEVARALVQAGARRGRTVEVTFVAPRIKGPSHEAVIRRAGFPLEFGDITLDEAAVASILRADHDATEFISDFNLAKRFIEALLAWVRERRPNLVIFGFLPPVGIACKILSVPSVTYLPFPMHEPWVKRHLLKDLPEPLENRLTARLPRRVRCLIARGIALTVARTPFFRQPTFAAAGRACGWQEPRPNLFSMLAADVELVNDVPLFFEGRAVGPRCHITGPLFSRPPDADVDPRIAEALAPHKPRKVFLSMGSSGEKRHLLAAIVALCGMDVNAVVVVPPAICSLIEVRRTISVPKNIHLTDAFIPAHKVNPLADAAVIHGGQGTVQTALYSGTPFVGVGFQAEQCSNLDNLVLAGAGIRIPRKLWSANSIRTAIVRVLTVPAYRRNALRLRQSALEVDGWRESGEAIWKLVESLPEAGRP
jgi:UDP:flavonoid glycosyltransferase YjiC (YdhE family)